ncbi:hypothetical protein AG1IA_07332 [Rhizoctonia solani AG-1 IA]|uniref:Uncharacterized protein n=1 Tax=Thanatephorus cucumeris (strain AG1-IA) TaxID=983506 RepID=L8WKA3_THACA|nr:hypothetical protein AG1IA_07332 [Rhizoctonia solani AG-1 IA]
MKVCHFVQRTASSFQLVILAIHHHQSRRGSGRSSCASAARVRLFPNHADSRSRRSCGTPENARWRCCTTCPPATGATASHACICTPKPISTRILRCTSPASSTTHATQSSVPIVPTPSPCTSAGIARFPGCITSATGKAIPSKATERDPDSLAGYDPTSSVTYSRTNQRFAAKRAGRYHAIKKSTGGIVKFGLLGNTSTIAAVCSVTLYLFSRHTKITFYALGNRMLIPSRLS